MTKYLKPFRRLILPLLLGTLLFPFPLRAEEAGTAPSGEDRLLNLETEVNTEEWRNQVQEKLEQAPLEPEAFSVTGARHPEKVSHAPAAVTVLDEEDLKLYSVGSLEEIFRLVPGLEVVVNSPSYKMVGIRGFFPAGVNNVLVLVDGREVNTNFIGEVYWDFIPVSLDDIKKIEIIRGPVSALYGANAFAGVINIITKEPRDEKRAEAITEVGGYNTDLGTLFFKAKGAYQGRSWGFKLSADRQQSWSSSVPGEPAAEVNRVSLKTGSDLPHNSRVDVDASFAFGDSRSYAVIGEAPVTDILLSTIYLHGNWDKLNFKLGYYRFNFDMGLDIPYLPPWMIRGLFGESYPIPASTNNLEGGLDYSVYLGVKNRLTFGAGYLLNTFQSSALAKEYNQEQRIGAYVQDEWNFLPPLSLFTAFRYDYNSKTSDDYSPRVSLVYTPHPRHTLRASFARAFRKPSFWEYGMNLKTMNLSSSNLSNEHINSFELGYNSRLSRHLSLTAALFYNQYRDIVGFDEDQIFTKLETHSDSIGGELALDLVLRKNLKGFANASYVEPIDRSGGRPEVHLDLHPKYKSNFGVSWQPLPALSLSLTGSLIGPKTDRILDSSGATQEMVPQKLPAQFLLGTRLAYSFFSDHAEVGVKIYNLLGNEGRQYPGADWNYDIDGDGQAEATNFAGEKQVRTITGFVRISW
ncbi:MAG: TonB-dependent receptor [bacterium]|nr:TonB-dependent receptor [bacterium]